VTSWQVRSGSNRWIADWINDYVPKHYKLVGVAEYVPPQSRYVWGDAARTYKEESDSAIEVLERSDLPELTPSGPLVP